MNEVKDRWGDVLKVRDRIEYVTVYNHSPYFNKGIIVDIDTTREYGDTVQVLGDTKNKPGWTYPYRILKIR